MATERSVLVRLRANADQFNREMMKAREAVHGVRDEIDTTNDRTAWLAQGFLALAPALVPLGAAAVPVLSGIAAQATVAVAAVGVMALAFHGVGDALTALDKYQITPTAENLKKLHDAMQKLGPDGAHFVRFLDDAKDKLSVLQMDARAGMFPGMETGINDVMRMLPRLRDIVQEIASGLGELSIDAGKGLAGKDMRGFFNYLRTDAKPILVEMGHTIGNFISGFGAMLKGFAPLTSDFSHGLLEMSRSFSDWAHGLDSSQTFQDFVQYVRESAPKALDLLGAFVDAFVQLTEAAAPVGDVALPVLTKFLDIVASIADTPAGSLLILTAALTSMYGRIVALRAITTGGVVDKMTVGFRESTAAAKASIPTLRQWGYAAGSVARSQKQLKANIMEGSTSYALASARASSARFAIADFAKAAGPAAAAGGLLALSMTGIADKAGLSNTAMGASVGLMATRGPWGAAIGAAIGLTTDLASANNDLESALKAVNTAMDSGRLSEMRAAMRSIHEQFKDMRNTDGFGDFMSDSMAQLNDLGGGLWDKIMGKDHVDQWARSRNALEGIRTEIEYIKHTTGGGWSSDGLELFYRGLGFTADEARRASEGVDAFSRSVEHAQGILDRQAAFDAYQAAVDAATKSLKDNGKTLDNNTEKGRNNRAALRDMAKTALEAGDGLKGLARNNYLEHAADKYAAMAQAMGMGEKAAKRWAARLFDLDNTNAVPHIDVDDKKARAKVKKILADLGFLDHSTGTPAVDLLIQQFLKGKVTVAQMMKILNGLKANPHVGADTAEAITKIHGVISAMSSIHDKVVHIQTVFSRNNLNVDTGADGATVPKTGRPYADRHLYLLADGERVTSNRHGQVDKSAKLLNLINQGRINDRVVGLADGGTAGGDTVDLRTVTRSGDDPVGSEARKTAAALKGLRGELKRATEALDKEKKERDAVIAKMKAVRSGVTGGLRSDLFGETDAWTSQYGGGSPAGVMSDLRGDKRNARAMLAAIHDLKAKGLHGAALAEILQEGGLAGAQAFAQLTRAELHEYADLFNSRNRLTRAAGEAAGNASYGAAVRRERHEFRELKQEVVRLRHSVERASKHNREDHKADRDSQKRGAGDASRSRRRD